MAHRPQRIEFENFAGNLEEVFEQVRRCNEPVLVERDGETFRLERDASGDIWKDYDPERVQKAMAASVGVLKGVDIDSLLEELKAQRE